MRVNLLCVCVCVCVCMCVCAYRRESAGSGSRVRYTVSGRRHDAPVGNQDNILAAELLLQLPHQTLLNLVERLQQTEGHLVGYTCTQVSLYVETNNYAR